MAGRPPWSAGPLVEAASLLGPLAEPDAPLGALTTYRVGGRAALLVRAGDEGALGRVAAAVRATGLPVVVVGRGSNLLVADRGFPGIAVVLGGRFEAVDLSRRPQVTAGGAATLPALARQLAAAGLTGFEWAVGVPGSLGGAVRMNAGGHGSDMRAVTSSAGLFDLRTGEAGERSGADLAFGYRSSSVRTHEVVTWARLELRDGDADAGRAAISEIVRWRREHQPGGQNAGSVFTNPEGDAAGRLVDAAGCKGLRIGTASVSTKHANFIQADEGGSAADVLAVIREVRRRVEEHGGVRLHPELRLVGFAPEDLEGVADG